MPQMNHITFPDGKRHVFYVVLLLIVYQNFTACAESFPGRTFTSARRDITAMVCDDSYLWAGTSREGLLRIDKTSGETVIYFFSDSGIDKTSIQALSFDSDGALLAGTPRDGIVRFVDSKPEPVSGLPDSSTLALTIDSSGEPWAWMYNEGVIRRDGDEWITVVNQFCGEMTSSPDGSVWLLNVPLSDSVDCSNGWIRKYGADGEMKTSISLEPICTYLGERHLFAVDDYDNCWIATTDHLIRINGDEVDLYPVDTATEHKKVNGLTVGRDNVVLFALSNYTSKTCGIYLHDQTDAGELFDSCLFTLDGANIGGTFADEADGGFWLATVTGKLVRIEESGNVFFHASGNAVLPANSVTSVLVAGSDDVWVGTPEGIARCRESVWSLYPAENDTLPGTHVSSLAMDSSGTVWAGFQQPLMSAAVTAGLSQFSGDHWSLLARHMYSVRAITVDAEGTRWVAADNGIHCYQEEDTVIQLERTMDEVWKLEKTDGRWVNAIAFDAAGTLWIGTYKGIKRYENGSWIDDTSIQGYFPESGDSVKVNALCIQNSTTWIGTDFGLLKCAGGEDCLRIDTSGGMLPDAQVQCLMADGSAGVWVGTKQGLVRLNGQDHMTYTMENTPLYENNITACTVAHNGDVWVGTFQGGLTVLRQPDIAVKHDAFPMRKNGLPAGGITFSTVHNRSCMVALQTSRRPVEVVFTVISLKGTVIRQLKKQTVKAGIVTLFWNGTDRFNRPVSAGMYLGVVSVNGGVVGSKLLPLQ
jgi:ligand-binding sensor domain-containing protein